MVWFLWLSCQELELDFDGPCESLPTHDILWFSIFQNLALESLCYQKIISL